MTKKEKIVIADFVVIFLMILGMIAYLKFKPAHQPLTMRIISCTGNKQTMVKDIHGGHVVFFICKNEVFYIDTTQGYMWHLEKDGQIDPEQMKIVAMNAIDVAATNKEEKDKD